MRLHFGRMTLVWILGILCLGNSLSLVQAEVKSLSVLPEQIHLRGADSEQQLLITGHYAEGNLRDLTHQAAFQATDPKVAQVLEGGLVLPVGNGGTEIIAEFQGRVVKIPVTVKDMERELPINFTNEIIPIFNKLGCNSGGCHGKSGGQNGFALSLLGFEPHKDYDALVKEGRGRRIFPAAAEHSLMLLKATGKMAHGGGKLLAVHGSEYRRLVRWIRSGLPFGSSADPHVMRISLSPAHRVLDRQAQQQLMVTAHYSDGTSEDVTHRAEYLSNDPELVTVNAHGLAETLDLTGEGSVMVRYRGQVEVFRATIPLGIPSEKFTHHTPANFIDEHVFAKLKELGLPPSAICSDSEFLRRASLDITGTLPTPGEVEKFLADKSPNKRAKLVDELLERPAYASYFALKWSDLLRNRRGNAKDFMRTVNFHAWIRDSLQKNKPYHQFVREIITATGPIKGDEKHPPAAAWYHELRTPQALVDDTAQVFLGMRLQCAQCHHHPFEKWSQDDYWGLAAFYGRVQWQGTKGQPLKIPALFGIDSIGVAADGQVKSPEGKIYTQARTLEGDEYPLAKGGDPRQKLVDWMVQPENPYFAPALVNRYWAHFFGRGIVDPPDDMRITNPPSNPELLKALACDFRDSGFDLKHLVRTICNSKTYQLSAMPNEFNKKDRKNFARFQPRRVQAEVLLDAIDQVLGTTTAFNRLGTKVPPGTRAIDLPDETTKTYFLNVFGSPKRESACECERVTNVTLAQRLHLLNSGELQSKLANAESRPAKLAADPRPDADKVKEIYLWCFGRHPTAQEQQAVLGYLARGTNDQTRKLAYEDLFWALINTKEFQFNH